MSKAGDMLADRGSVGEGQVALSKVQQLIPALPETQGTVFSTLKRGTVRTIGATLRALGEIQAPIDPLTPTGRAGGRDPIQEATKKFGEGLIAKAESVPRIQTKTKTGKFFVDALESFPSSISSIAAGALATRSPRLAATLAFAPLAQIYDENFQAAVAGGATPMEAHNIAAPASVISGSLELLGGGSIANQMAKVPVSGARRAMAAAARIGRAARDEFGTEAAQSVITSMIRIGYDPEMDVADPDVLRGAAYDAMYSGAVGAVLGGGISSVGVSVQEARQMLGERASVQLDAKIERALEAAEQDHEEATLAEETGIERVVEEAEPVIEESDFPADHLGPPQTLAPKVVPIGASVQPVSSFGPVVDQTDATQVALEALEQGKLAAAWIFTPMIDRVRKFGGPLGPAVADAAEMASDTAQMLRGKFAEQTIRFQRLLESPANWLAVQRLQRVKWNQDGTVGYTVFQLAAEHDAVLEALDARERALVGEFRKLTLAIGEEAKARGFQIELNDGTWAPFEPVEGGRRLSRQFTDEMFGILRDGPQSPVFRQVARVLAQENGLDEDVSMRHLEAMAERSLERRAAFEVARVFKNFPSHIRHGGLRVNLLNAHPHTAAKTMVDRSALRMGFAEQFGQGTPADPNSLQEIVAATGPDTKEAQRLIDLFRALNGLPVTVPFQGGRGMALLIRSMHTVLGLDRALKLTRAFIPNMPETLSKVPAAVGWMRLLRGWATVGVGSMSRWTHNETRQHLIRIGAIMPDIADFSIDPNRRISSGARALGNLITSPRRVVDDLNEAVAATSAYAMVRDMQEGRASRGDREHLDLLGFNEQEIDAMMSGEAPQRLYDRAVRRVVTFTQNTIATPAQQSRAASSRTYATWVAFDRYGQFTMNRFATTARRVSESAKANGPLHPKTLRAAKTFGDFLVGSAASGMIATSMAAAFVGGVLGLKDQWQKSKREPMAATMDFLRYALLGGLSDLLLYNLVDRAEFKAVDVIGGLQPVSLGQDIIDYAAGSGPYENLDSWAKANKFLDRHAAAAKGIRHAFAVAGFSDMDPVTQGALRAHYRWLRDNEGFVDRIPPLKGIPKEQADFYKAMKRAAEAARNGHADKAHAAMIEALGTGHRDAKGVIASLRARKVLPSVDVQNRERYRQEMLPEYVERLEQADRLIDELISQFRGEAE